MPAPVPLTTRLNHLHWDTCHLNSSRRENQAAPGHAHRPHFRPETLPGPHRQHTSGSQAIVHAGPPSGSTDSTTSVARGKTKVPTTGTGTLWNRSAVGRIQNVHIQQLHLLTSCSLLLNYVPFHTCSFYLQPANLQVPSTPSDPRFKWRHFRS